MLLQHLYTAGESDVSGWLARLRMPRTLPWCVHLASPATHHLPRRQRALVIREAGAATAGAANVTKRGRRGSNNREWTVEQQPSQQDAENKDKGLGRSYTYMYMFAVGFC